MKRSRFSDEHVISILQEHETGAKRTARVVIHNWAIDYNANRPHSALGYETPRTFTECLTFATDCSAVSCESFSKQLATNLALNGVSIQKRSRDVRMAVQE